MNTIIWIVKNVFSIAVIAIIIVLQPELRKALEELGRKNIFASIFDMSKTETGLFSDSTIKEITKACMEMGKVRTGALIVVRQMDNLTEYEQTGIAVDAIVTNQLLINIFEHNTPLHDGAVIIDGDRITSATCYLPLSDNMRLSKELGTRHRAGVGISEVTDSMTVIVSEETGSISVAYKGELYRNLGAEELEIRLESIQNKQAEEKKRAIWKGKGARNEAKTN
jgi:diadenylate cyclase